MSSTERAQTEKIFRDYEMGFGRSVIFVPFEQQIKELENQGYRIGKIANLFALFFRPTESDPEGAKLLQKMQQIPMVEITKIDDGETCIRTSVFLRNNGEQKAIASIVIANETKKNPTEGATITISGDAWAESPEFQYVTGLLFSKVGPFSDLNIKDLIGQTENFTEMVKRGSQIGQ